MAYDIPEETNEKVDPNQNFGPPRFLITFIMLGIILVPTLIYLFGKYFTLK